MFRRAHWHRLTDRSFTIEELGEEAGIKLLRPLLGTLLTFYTNYCLHRDQLDVHYEIGVICSAYAPSVQYTSGQHL